MIPRVALAALLALTLDVAAELRVAIVETSPPLPTVLSADEPLFLRVEYSDAERSHLWALPFYKGERVARVRFNPSLPYEGSGVTLAWFSLDGEDKVDEVRIRTSGGKPYREIEVLRYPVDVRGTGQRAEPQTRAAWVADLLKQNEAKQKAHDAKPSAEPVADMLLLSGLGFVVMGFVAANVFGPLWALWKWRRAWRVLGLLPLPMIAVVVGRIVIDTSRDPTSHNLWPFEILIFGGCGAAVFVAIALLRRVLGGSS